MARRLKERQRALELRKEGNSYSQIKQILGINKGTLSSWLKDHPLSEEQKRNLGSRRIENYISTRRKNREIILEKIYLNQKRKLLPLTHKQLLVAGLCLYWGEGSKSNINELRIANTDPSVIKAGMYWLERVFSVPRSKLTVRLHLYRDMDVQKETAFWSKLLNLPPQSFKKPYVKDSLLTNVTYKNGFGHGTCNLMLYDGKVSKQVFAGLRVFREYFLVSDSKKYCGGQ